jgi:hypothetical protein
MRAAVWNGPGAMTVESAPDPISLDATPDAFERIRAGAARKLVVAP